MECVYEASQGDCVSISGYSRTVEEQNIGVGYKVCEFIAPASNTGPKPYCNSTVYIRPQPYLAEFHVCACNYDFKSFRAGLYVTRGQSTYSSYLSFYNVTSKQHFYC